MNKIETTIRDVTPEDKAALISLCQITGLFQPHELEELGNMLSAYFEDKVGHKWLTDEEDGELRGVAYYASETFASGVSNLLFK